MSRTPVLTHNSHCLDMLRGLAACGVVMFHLNSMATKLGLTNPIYKMGSSGVMLFFVLSGYFITRSVLVPKTFDPLRYGRHRLCRIVPNYYFSLFLVLCVVSPGRFLVNGGWWDLLVHLFFLHGWFHQYRESIYAVYWTLTNEACFYLFILLTAGLLRRPLSGWVLTGAALLFSVGYKLVIAAQPGWSAADDAFWYRSFPGTLDQFAWGMLAALALQRPGFKSWSSRPLIALAGLLPGLLLLGYICAGMCQPQLLKPFQSSIFIWSPLIYCLGAALVVIFIQPFERWLGPWMVRSGLAWLGMISYSIYLYHVLIISAYYNLWLQNPTAFQPAWFIVLVCAIILAFASATYWLVERPFMAKNIAGK